jgi:leucyl aminopeptidase (aminopeptidase T)
MEMLTLLAGGCKTKGAEATVMLIDPKKQDHMDYVGPEPPRPVALAMRESDVIITMGARSLLQSEATKEALAAGARFATLGPSTPAYLAGLSFTEKDLKEVLALSDKIAQHLTAASRAHLTTKAGTDLRMSLEGRNGIALVPVAKRGTKCVIPYYAEATCAPVEDSVEGVAVVDGTMIGEADLVGLVQDPFEIHFKKGRIVKITEGRDANRLKDFLDAHPLGKEAQTFGEFGINSNHKIPKKLTGNRTDDVIAGNVHLGLGRNDHIGGNSRVKLHLDVMVTRTTVLLDQTPILKDGKLMV